MPLFLSRALTEGRGAFRRAGTAEGTGSRQGTGDRGTVRRGERAPAGTAAGSTSHVEHERAPFLLRSTLSYAAAEAAPARREGGGGGGGVGEVAPQDQN